MTAEKNRAKISRRASARVGDARCLIAIAGEDGRSACHGVMPPRRTDRGCASVVRATRTGSGVVARNVEVDDDKLGLIAAMELNPQKARILLMLGLMQTKDPKKLQEFFYAY